MIISNNITVSTISSRRLWLLGCDICRGRIAAQFSRLLRKPRNSERIVTGNYLIDYQDSVRKFGAMLHGIIVANPSTNIPEVIYITLNNYGNGMHTNHVSVSCLFLKTRTKKMFSLVTRIIATTFDYRRISFDSTISCTSKRRVSFTRWRRFPSKIRRI